MRAVGDDSNALQVRKPAATRFVHRVADIVAGHRPLSADVATLSHEIVLPLYTTV